jgi:CopG family nickel-responsive transcriptional regulator
MDRFTISLSEELAAAFDELIAERGYASRSEAVRDILRRELQERAGQRDDAGPCVASLSYVYDHHERSLAERLTELQHEHHDLTVAAMHAHLDHDNCLEAVMLKGRVRDVRRFADSLIAERGVRHGQLNLIHVSDAAHSHHPAAGERDGHATYRPDADGAAHGHAPARSHPHKHPHRHR